MSKTDRAVYYTNLEDATIVKNKLEKCGVPYKMYESVKQMVETLGMDYPVHIKIETFDDLFNKYKTWYPKEHISFIYYAFTPYEVNYVIEFN